MRVHLCVVLTGRKLPLVSLGMNLSRNRAGLAGVPRTNNTAQHQHNEPTVFSQADFASLHYDTLLLSMKLASTFRPRIKAEDREAASS